uniref:Uncharacterized protein n=1 Tax=Parascaris univalens TaxID=6257 RepID=A0A915CK63_PARUN
MIKVWQHTANDATNLLGLWKGNNQAARSVLENLDHDCLDEPKRTAAANETPSKRLPSDGTAHPLEAKSSISPEEGLPKSGVGS